ncbi:MULTISPECIES: hypothetical protein [Halalkalibacter]|jgi:hypothetical protein|uniref:Uncharacterized protein n=1 Tax=Halalkalibacter alkaliphilus TaxID=2917993 RepID=A0A9X1ZYR9_9BACI|nr:hypothetical protein [Halalkalibacter alkaliphilus]MCL7746107.1 hypothetical protein [Halalkalibacter alkaliphilus]
MDKKDKLNNENTYRAGNYASTDNHIPKSVRDEFFSDDMKTSRKKNK